MNKLTEAYLDKLLEQHPDGDVRDTVMAIKTRFFALAHEVDVDRKTILMEEMHDLNTVLQHELREAGRAGEDYINDGVFHATGRA
jgi:hypothetical protein